MRIENCGKIISLYRYYFITPYWSIFFSRLQFVLTDVTPVCVMRQLVCNIIQPHIVKVKPIVLIITLLISFNSIAKPLQNPKVIIYPAPKSELLNTDFRLFAEGRKIPVYNTRVSAGDASNRFKAIDDAVNSHKYFDTAAFAYFDIRGNVMMRLATKSTIKSIKILPLSSHVIPIISGKNVNFKMYGPQNLTIEINGDIIHSLHVFASGPEINPPTSGNKNLIYFGPGLHSITSMVINDGQNVYIAGGAIVKAVIGKNELFGIEPTGLRNYLPAFILKGKNIKFSGRGIIDASALPTHARNLIYVEGSHISLEGVILKDPPVWALPVRKSALVTLNNIKIIGYRANSDGIDISNSKNVSVTNCFVRTGDDLIVIKTQAGEGVAENIIVKKCVLWNQTAHALSLGTEIREKVSNVLFSDCDVIHDIGREWSLRIFQTDGAEITNIKFENIRIEESHNFLSLLITKIPSSFDKNLGYLNNISLKNISVTGNPLGIEILGGDLTHFIDGVKFDSVFLNGRLIETKQMRINQFVSNLSIH